MNWRLFKKDDPDTWPEFDCPIVVSKIYGETISVHVSKWDNKLHKFYDEDGHYYNYDECYYSYITYIPKGYKVYHPVRCKNDDNCKIGCNDNGYCIYDCECEQRFVVSEYEIIPKLIVKEFK